MCLTETRCHMLCHHVMILGMSVNRSGWMSMETFSGPCGESDAADAGAIDAGTLGIERELGPIEAGATPTAWPGRRTRWHRPTTSRRRNTPASSTNGRFGEVPRRLPDHPWVEPIPRLQALRDAVSDRPACAETRPYV